MKIHEEIYENVKYSYRIDFVKNLFHIYYLFHNSLSGSLPNSQHLLRIIRLDILNFAYNNEKLEISFG